MDSQEARIFIAIVIAVLVLAAIIIYFAISMIRQQRRNLELQKANVLAEISAMEKERARIAADLHDELGPVMSVIKFRVDDASQSDKVEQEQLSKASEQLDGLIGRMREIANNLMPRALQRKGLVTAVDEYISKMQDTVKIKFSFEHPDKVELPEDKAIHVYRALQEVIHNCIKHSGADTMEIRMEKKPASVSIFCRDNGKGFDHEKIGHEATGIGLGSLKNRTEILGGTMILESKPGKGTAFLFDIPVK
jgi:two-component system, NarL family, sensor kinase